MRLEKGELFGTFESVQFHDNSDVDLSDSSVDDLLDQKDTDDDTIPGVKTPRQVYEMMMTEEGHNVCYFRCPITDEQAPRNARF